MHDVDLFKLLNSEVKISRDFPSLQDVFFTRASIGKLESKNARRLVAKRGVMVPDVSCVESGNWGREYDSLLYCVIALRERRKITNTVFCEVSFGKNHALCVDLTYKDVDRFRNGTVHELSCLKACQISKVHARSYERTNFVSHVRVQTTKTLAKIYDY